RRELAVRVRRVGADGDDGQRGALPQILVLDLRHRDIELLEAIFHAAEHHSLVFQGLRAVDVQFDGEKSYDHTEFSHEGTKTRKRFGFLRVFASSCYAETATRSFANTSMRSPTLMSLK